MLFKTNRFRLKKHSECFTNLGKLNLTKVVRLSQFLLLPLLPQKMKLGSKVVKIDSNINPRNSLYHFPWDKRVLKLSAVCCCAG